MFPPGKQIEVPGRIILDVGLGHQMRPNSSTNGDMPLAAIEHRQDAFVAQTRVNEENILRCISHHSIESVGNDRNITVRPNRAAMTNQGIVGPTAIGIDARPNAQLTIHHHGDIAHV